LGVAPALEVPASNDTDDTTAIQAVLNEGGTIVFPAGGTWLVDAETGLFPVSNSRIIVERGATVQVITNDADLYRLFNISAVSNVTLEGDGILLGDLDTHTGTTGEYGHLVHITNGSSNIVVRDITIKKAWGDGIYIGGTAQCSDVIVDGVRVEDCRREGIAPFWVDGCTIRNCRIVDIGVTAATSPASGIDCEPNAGEAVNNLTLENNHVENCQGCGIYCSQNPGTVTNLVIRDNTVIDCGLSEASLTTYQWNGIHVSTMDRPVLIDNVVEGCGYDDLTNGVSGGIYLRTVTNATVKGGRLSSGLGRGLYITGCTSCDVSGVTVENNDYHGIYVYDSDGTVLRGNHVLDNVQYAGDNDTVEHVIVQSSDDCLVQGNTLRGDAGHSWLRVRTSGDDNLLINNVGLGTPPANTLVDAGTRTVEYGNFRKASSIFTPFSADDGAASGDAKAYADLIGWTYDPATVLSGTILPAAATLYLGRIPLPATVEVTNLIMSLSVLGNTLTNSYLALYTSDGTMVGQTADQSSNWGSGGSTGVKTVALTSPVTVTPVAPNDFVWVAVYVGTASVLPTFVRGVAGQSSLLNTGLGSRKRYASYAVADTATMPNVTPGSLNPASHAYWMALS